MNLAIAPRHLALLLLVTMAFPPPGSAEDRSFTPIKAIRPGKALSADDLADLLDVQIWKLRVDLPRKAKYVRMGLEIRERGGTPEAWSGRLTMGPLSPTEGEVMVAIIPIGGQPLDKADEVRVILSGFTGSTSMITENPFKSLRFLRPGTPEITEDGSFGLIGGSAGNKIQTPIASADKVISLRITTSE